MVDGGVGGDELEGYGDYGCRGGGVEVICDTLAV